jgi:hypothetical protein
VTGKKFKLQEYAFDFQEFCQASGDIMLLVTYDPFYKPI